MDAHYDVAIVGGGLVGAALAFGMRSLGSRLAVLDEGERAFRASRGNFGLIWVQGKGLGLYEYANWTQRSAREWARFAPEVGEASGIDVAWSQPGGLHLCLSQQALEARAAMLARVVDQPGVERYEVQVLSRAELERRVPRIGPTVAGGTWTALDGHCDPLRLLHALHVALQRAGVHLRTNERVERIERPGSAFALGTRSAEIRAERVVLAAGLGSTSLGAMIGLHVPVVPNKGHVAVTERVAPFLRFPIENVRQSDEGRLLLGDSQQECGFDDSLSLEVLGAIARRTSAMFPFLAGVQIVRAWAALRVMTPDGFPVYAQSQAMPGAFAVACHSGVTLAAVHARVLAPALLAGALPDALRPFSPERFGHVRAAA